MSDDGDNYNENEDEDNEDNENEDNEDNEDNDNLFGHEFNVGERTSIYNIENKNLSDEERIEKTIINITIALNLSIENRNDIITNIININNIKYKNPYGIVFGYLVSKTKDNFRDIISEFNDFKKKSEYEISVTEIDILRYSRLWENIK